jgi:hypothetical protein
VPPDQRGAQFSRVYLVRSFQILSAQLGDPAFSGLLI